MNDSLEDNWFDSAESLQSISEEQWSQLKLPMALVNAIKKKLLSESSAPTKITIPPPVLVLQHDTEMIDTSSTKVLQKVVAVREEMKQNETQDMGLSLLMQLRENEMYGNDAGHRDTLKTLFTIIANLLAKPLDPTVRRFNKSNKSIQAKILAYPSAVKFLILVSFDLYYLCSFQIGFNFEKTPDQAELVDYKKDVLNSAIETLELHIKNMGGKV